MFPYPGKSHFDVFVRFFEALAQKGHNVTVLNHYPRADRMKNYRDIQIAGKDAFMRLDISSMLDLKNIKAKSRLVTYLQLFILEKLTETQCEIGFSSEAVQNFLKENNHFDLAITEYFNSDCFLTIAKKFDIPVVRVHSCTLMPWSNERYGNPDNPSYVPNNFLPFSDKMNFLQRVENLLLTVFQSVYFNYFVINTDKKVSMKYFGELGSTIDGDVRNDSLILVNTHYTVNLPRPLVPNVVEVGGIHLGQSNLLPQVSNNDRKMYTN